MLMEENLHPKIVAELMGHEKANLSVDRYTHIVSSDVCGATAQLLDKGFAKIVQAQNPTSS